MSQRSRGRDVVLNQEQFVLLISGADPNAQATPKRSTPLPLYASWRRNPEPSLYRSSDGLGSCLAAGSDL